MKEREIKTLWVAGTPVSASAGFVVLGTMPGSSPVGWNIHVVSASAWFAGSRRYYLPGGKARWRALE
jgi:hypothetical protein